MNDENNKTLSVSATQISSKEVYSAFVKAQAELTNPRKTEQGYGYKFAGLPSVVTILKVLNKHGLAYIQMIQPDDHGKLMLELFLMHESGERLPSSFFPFEVTQKKGMSPEQSLGSCLTYFRRYQLTTYFGIASEEDIDGAGEVESIPEPKPKPKPKPPAKKAEPKPEPEAEIELSDTEIRKLALEKLSELKALKYADAIGFYPDTSSIKACKTFLNFTDQEIKDKVKKWGNK
jgi:hypothetical protein